MPKKLVKTTGSFMLVDTVTGDVVDATRPSVVQNSGFIQARAAAEQLTVLAGVDDDATDEEFATYWKKSGYTAESDDDEVVAGFRPKQEAPKKAASKTKTPAPATE